MATRSSWIREQSTRAKYEWIEFELSQLLSFWAIEIHVIFCADSICIRRNLKIENRTDSQTSNSIAILSHDSTI